MKRLSSLLALLLLCGHLFRWDLQQLRMWVDMIDSATQKTSLLQAVSDTLGGGNPCPTCIRLTREKSSAETEDAIVASEPPLSPLLPCTALALPQIPCAGRTFHPEPFALHNPATSPPLLPPPIFIS